MKKPEFFETCLDRSYSSPECALPTPTRVVIDTGRKVLALAVDSLRYASERPQNILSPRESSAPVDPLGVIEHAQRLQVESFMPVDACIALHQANQLGSG